MEEENIFLKEQFDFLDVLIDRLNFCTESDSKLHEQVHLCRNFLHSRDSKSLAYNLGILAKWLTSVQDDISHLSQFEHLVESLTTIKRITEKFNLQDDGLAWIINM